MSKKVLVVDDAEGDRKLIEDKLNSHGITEVFLAQDASSGYALMLEYQPEIVIVDTLLPGEGGIELCQRIKDKFQDKVCVIVVTGKIDAVDVGKARHAGADDFCVKTSNCEELVKAIEIYL